MTRILTNREVIKDALLAVAADALLDGEVYIPVIDIKVKRLLADLGIDGDAPSGVES